jgi:hypothetical protein
MDDDRSPRIRWVAALAAGLWLLGGAAAGALEVEVEAEIAPYGRSLAITAWADFLLVGGESEAHHLFPVAADDRVVGRFTVIAGSHPLEGRLEEVLFPATAFVGRSCPPQQYAELVEVRPRREGRDRAPRPVAEASHRGGWRGFSPAGADALQARYLCFPAVHEMVADELPPDPRTPPPSAASAPAAPPAGEEPEAAPPAPGETP